MIHTMFKKINFQKNKKYIIGTVIFIALLLIVVGNNNKDADIVRGSVTRGTISSAIRLAGKVESLQDVSLRFSMSGTIQDVYVVEGQEVKEGDRLMSLDNRSLFANLLGAQANLELQKAESKVSNAELDLAVQNAYTDLLNNDLQAYPLNYDDDYNLEAPEVVGSFLGKTSGEYQLEIYSSAASSGASFRYSGFEKGSDTVNKYSPSKLGNLGLSLQFDDASNYQNTDWVIPIPNTRSSSYSSALNAYQSALASRDATESNNVSEQITSARIKQAEAEVAKIQAEIHERILRAPFAGTVSFLGPNKGEIASADEVAVSLISPNNYKIIIQVPEVDLSDIQMNQVADVSLDAYPNQTFKAHVVSVDSAETIVDGVSVYEATLYFDEPYAEIKSGMSATVDIVTNTKENVLMVKKQFIEKDEAGEYVYVYMEGEHIKTYITTGLTGTDGSVEVLGGLTESDNLIGKFE